MQNDFPVTDRLGQLLGQIRLYEGVTIEKLADGLCSTSLLGRIEAGEREIDQQLADTFFQRLGKPAELYERILDEDEFQSWQTRQKIIQSLNNGDFAAAGAIAKEYCASSSEVLDHQFCAIVEINCYAAEGADAARLFPMVSSALKLTQPELDKGGIATMLLSKNEGQLLFTILRLREDLEGYAAVEYDYHALMHNFSQKRYEARERVYRIPCVALRIIENDYAAGRYASALVLCENLLEDLTREKSLLAYAELLEWKQRLHDAMGNPDRTPEKLLCHLKNIMAYAPEQQKLLIPCEESGNIYCLNDVLRTRRILLGLSQEELAADICATNTLSRVENHRCNLQKRNRRTLLQRVNMSGERYDYEVVTDRYEDYILRSELDRMIKRGDMEKAQELFELLRRRTPDTLTNRQYINNKSASLRFRLPAGHPDKISVAEYAQQLKDAIRLTLPLDFDDIGAWKPCVLAINEMLCFLSFANCCERLGKLEECLSILDYIRRCLGCSCKDGTLYVDLYTRVQIGIASVLGSMKRYRESSTRVQECLALLIQNQRSDLLPWCLLGEAWNIFHQKDDIKQKTQICTDETVIEMFRRAYAASIISGDVVRQRSVSRHCRKRCGVELEL